LLHAFYAIGGGDLEIFISHNERLLDEVSGLPDTVIPIWLFSGVNRKPRIKFCCYYTDRSV
jgi:hypothetical protein